jgi:predicted oxidoreductase
VTVAEPVTSTRPPDAIVVGAGLAGLFATYELVQAGRSVLVIDQENRHNLGGQAFWSLGGLFLVDSPADGLTRIAKPHRLLDPKHGPLIAVRLNILTRKTLGGLETNLDSQVMRPDGAPFEGLYAAGEVAGFGGGGVHGYNALEGTFLGGCIFSGRAAGRAIARQVGASARERVSRG